MSRKIRTAIFRAISTCNGPTDFVFHLGYQGMEIPRPLRRLLAKSSFHQAWLSGFYGGGICKVLERYEEPTWFDSEYETTGGAIETAGYKAGIGGLPDTENPHPPGGWRSDIWREGWRRGLGDLSSEGHIPPDAMKEYYS